VSGGWDELIKEAQAQLVEQEAEEQEASAELGESVELAEEEAFTGRWRGYGKAWTKRGEVDVFLVWDTSGARRFAWPKTRLQREIDELQPNVGDEIAIVRGVDIPNSDPDRNPTQRYAVRVRASSAPLPDEEPTAQPSAAASVDDHIPFMPAS
jgi:hypothetical protein